MNEVAYITEKYKLNPGSKNYFRLVNALLGIEQTSNVHYQDELQAWKDQKFWGEASDLVDEMRS